MTSSTGLTATPSRTTIDWDLSQSNQVSRVSWPSDNDSGLYHIQNPDIVNIDLPDENVIKDFDSRHFYVSRDPIYTDQIIGVEAQSYPLTSDEAYQQFGDLLKKYDLERNESLETWYEIAQKYESDPEANGQSYFDCKVRCTEKNGGQ